MFELKSPKLLRVLFIHNFYRYEGGEDVVFRREVEVLRRFGHSVEVLSLRSVDFIEDRAFKQITRLVWSRDTYRELDRLISEFKPDVIHAHNTFPFVSPSVIWCAKRKGIPFVQTLHNFRLLCPQATLTYSGRYCDDCVGVLPWRAVVRKCYNNSSMQSLALSGMLSIHSLIGTYSSAVSGFIVLSDFAREVFLRGGLPAEKVWVKGNFLCSQDVDFDQIKERDGHMLYVGRLAVEKGIHVLIDALRGLPDALVKVVGDGPDIQAMRSVTQAECLGQLNASAVRREMLSASFLVIPSIASETFGMVAIEAMAHGLPIISSDIGALPEVIGRDGAGIFFRPGDSADLQKKIQWARENKSQLVQMGMIGRKRFLEHYSEIGHYRSVVEVYDRALRSHGELGQV